MGIHVTNKRYLSATVGRASNAVMKFLTVVTTLFMPLTLIVGWYGMNFEHMPELEFKYSYPIVFGFSLLLVIIMCVIFKKKKWW